MSRESSATTNRYSRAAIPVHVPEMERIALPRQRASHHRPRLQPSESDKPEPHQLYTNQQRVSIASAIAKHLSTPHPSKAPPYLLPARLLRRPPVLTPNARHPRDHHALRASTTTTSQPASTALCALGFVGRDRRPSTTLGVSACPSLCAYPGCPPCWPTRRARDSINWTIRATSSFEIGAKKIDQECFVKEDRRTSWPPCSLTKACRSKATAEMQWGSRVCCRQA